jgi:hypothetical protein
MRSFSSLVLVLTSAISLAFGPDTRAQEAPLTAFFQPHCPSEIPPAEPVSGGSVGALILEPLLRPLISWALDEAGAYLASAAAVKSAHMSALLDGYFYKLNDNGELSPAADRCLVLISAGSGKPVPSWFVKAKERAPNQLNPFSASPRFYFEAKIVAGQMPGDSRLIVTPNFLHIGEFLEDGWSYRNVRKYSVVATFRSRMSGDVFGSFTFDFDNLPRSTWGITQTISENEKDSSITPQLLQKAGSARVPFYPIPGAVSAAMLKQQQVAAPYLEADALLNSRNTAERRLADWEVRPRIDPKMSTEAQKYQEALEALCNSIDTINSSDKGGKGRLSDARCPVTHIGHMNLAEDARKVLEQKLAQDWARVFADSHVIENPPTCEASGSTYTCKPPKANPPNLGPYMMELAVVETREPTEFAKALATTFAANKDKLKVAIEDRTLPSRREAAEQSAEDAAHKAKITFELAKLDVEKAIAKLQEAASEPRSVQVALQAEVLKMKIAANAAAKAAGIEAPYAY